MKLLLDHSQLKVKGGHPPCFTFWCLKCFLETSSCVLVTPPSTRPGLFDQRSYSQHSTMWQNTDMGKSMQTIYKRICLVKSQDWLNRRAPELPELVFFTLATGMENSGHAVTHYQRWNNESSKEDEDGAQSSVSRLNINFLWHFATFSYNSKSLFLRFNSLNILYLPPSKVL